MSDHRANLDVEDVLSSIRRLVSQDARLSKPAPAPAMDKLVLTPSLRVNDAGEIGPSGAEERDALEETIVELEAAVASIEAEFEADEGELLDEAPEAADFGPSFALDEDAAPAAEIAASAEDDRASDLAEAAADLLWADDEDTEFDHARILGRR